MATSFPGAQDSFPTHSDGDTIYASIVNDVQDAVEALETKVGIDGSADPTSLDYRVTALESGGGGNPWHVWGTEYLPGTRTPESYAWKGAIFTPSADYELWGFRTANTGFGTSRTLSGALITVSGGTVATLVRTDDLVLGASVYSSNHFVDFAFSSPQTLSAGQPYGLMVGYVSGASTTSDLPLNIAPIQAWEKLFPRPGTLSSSVYHIAAQPAIVGSTVVTSANNQDSGRATYMVQPILRAVS